MMELMYMTVYKFFEALDRKLDCLDANRGTARLDRLPDFSDVRDDEIDELFAPFLVRNNDPVMA
jgi:hypothetical protein